MVLAAFVVPAVGWLWRLVTRRPPRYDVGPPVGGWTRPAPWGLPVPVGYPAAEACHPGEPARPHHVTLGREASAVRPDTPGALTVSERSTLRLAVLGLCSCFAAGDDGRAGCSSCRSSRPTSTRSRRRTTATARSSRPATRGLILDQLGRPLVANRTSLVVSVDRTALAKQKDDGVAVLTRLAKALGTTYTALSYKLELCGPDAHAKPPICWNGSPFQPIPVAKDISQDARAHDHGEALGLPGRHRRASRPCASTRRRTASTPRTCSATSAR